MNFYIINFWHDRRFRNRTGGPIKVLELAENLRAMGHDATLFVPKLGFPEKQTDSPLVQIPVVDMPVVRPLLRSGITLIKLISHSIRKKPDIIYIRYMHDFVPALFACLFRIPCIVEVNDEIRSSYSVTDRCLALLNRIQFGCADRIIVLTKGIKERLVSRFGIKPDKLVISTSGTNTDIFHPREKTTCREEADLDRSAVIIGFAGSFVWNYGIDILIEASPLIAERHPRVLFLIVGDGDAAPAWKERVDQLNMEDNFQFPGQVARERAAEYICAMDICVAPYHSTRGETSPVKLFDYLACARPVVASAIEALETVQNELPGLVLVEPDDPNTLAEGLIEVLDRYEYYEEQAEKTSEVIFEKYSWRRVAEDVVDVAQSIQ